MFFVVTVQTQGTEGYFFQCTILCGSKVSYFLNFYGQKVHEYSMNTCTSDFIINLLIVFEFKHSLASYYEPCCMLKGDS